MVESKVCFMKFSVLFIEKHAADFTLKFDILYVNSANEMDYGH